MTCLLPWSGRSPDHSGAGMMLPPTRWAVSQAYRSFEDNTEWEMAPLCCCGLKGLAKHSVSTIHSCFQLSRRWARCPLDRKKLKLCKFKGIVQGHTEKMVAELNFYPRVLTTSHFYSAAGVIKQHWSDRNLYRKDLAQKHSSPVVREHQSSFISQNQAVPDVPPTSFTSTDSCLFWGMISASAGILVLRHRRSACSTLQTPQGCLEGSCLISPTQHGPCQIKHTC